MLRDEFTQDVCGQKLGREYSLILTDPYFENRLKAFDANLKLSFNQLKKRWTILELAPDGSGWNVLMLAEDELTKEPRALGEWVFNILRAWRKQYERRYENPNKFFNGLISEAEAQAEEMKRKSREAGQYALMTDVMQWRRANREVHNLPASDATAGYPKVALKPKGVVYAP